jgi:hypothetical protein
VYAVRVMSGTYLFAIAARNSVSAVGASILVAKRSFILVSAIRTRGKGSLTQNVHIDIREENRNRRAGGLDV